MKKIILFMSVTVASGVLFANVFNSMVIAVADINHSDMDNDANETERRYMTTKILKYLKK